jgi:putative ABC transport system permease protein
MDVVWQDLRLTLRTLVRDPGFAAIIVLTLGVGIGINTAVFSLVHSILLAPLPYREADKLAMVWTDIPGQGVHEAGSAYANIEDWRAQNRVFEDLATYDPTSLTLTGREWPEQISAALVSANLFSVLGVAPSLGRPFTLEEEHQRAPVVVLSHDLWQRRFAGSPDATGQAIELGGRPFQVIGVMPAGFGFPDRNTQLWLPQTLLTDWDASGVRRGTGAWRVVGRLQSGVTPERARTDMRAIATRLEQMYPGDNAGLGINVVPLFDQVTGYSVRLALWTLFAAVGLVLLIACANAAHLILARGMDRSPEFALRAALGATTPRLLRQALTENLVIAVAAGIAGLVLAVGGLRVLVALAPAAMPRLDEIGVDGPVLIYAAAVSLCAGILSGIAPALSLSRVGLFALLKEGRGSTRRSFGHRVRNLLIVFQFTLAIILVFGANLLIRSLTNARSVDPGFESENVLMANLSVESPSERTTFYEQVLRDVQAIPGVRAAAIVEDLFISGAPSRLITIEGRVTDQPSFEQIRIDAIDGEFFQAMGVPFREGRGFSASDGADAAPVAIINETMARRSWGEESAVGKRFRTGAADSEAPWIEVVGVVGDMHRQGLEREPIPQVFRPYAQAQSRNMNLLVRSDAPLPGLIAAVRSRIAAIDGIVPLYAVTTVAQALDRYLVQRRFQTFLLGLFASVALVLAAVGIYGLIQHSVVRRTREMGVRVALGARSERLVWMILRQGFALALPGLAAGIVCALWLSDAVSALLFGVATSDLTNIVVTSGILLLTTFAACYVPARRAARVDPLTALRCQ